MKVKAKKAKETIEEYHHLTGKIVSPHNLRLIKLVAVDNYESILAHFSFQDLAHDYPNNLNQVEYYTEAKFEELVNYYNEKVFEDDHILTIIGFFRPGNGRIRISSLQNILVSNNL